MCEHRVVLRHKNGQSRLVQVRRDLAFRRDDSDKVLAAAGSGGPGPEPRRSTAPPPGPAGPPPILVGDSLSNDPSTSSTCGAQRLGGLGV